MQRKATPPQSAVKQVMTVRAPKAQVTLVDDVADTLPSRLMPRALVEMDSSEITASSQLRRPGKLRSPVA